MKRNAQIPVHLFMTILVGGFALGVAPQEARAGGDYCREYTRTVYIGGRIQEAYGTACLQPDGSWMVVGEDAQKDIPQNTKTVKYIIHDDRRDFVPTRVFYYKPSQRSYCPPRYGAPVFVKHKNGHRQKYHGHKNREFYDPIKELDRFTSRYDRRHDHDRDNIQFAIRYRYDD